MNNFSLENQLFMWTDWDKGNSYEDMVFYNVELKVPMGRFNIGDKFSSAYVCVAESYIELYLNAIDELPIAKFRLHLTIGEEL